MNIKMNVNDVRKKSLFWWRSLSKEMKKTMIHNPNVNKTENIDLDLMSRSTIQVKRMFINWLSWEVGE
tara:strand:+ start:897 stop:1100 length:204 start_codon:yes stop_codon:yes gene_type:complete